MGTEKNDGCLEGLLTFSLIFMVASLWNINENAELIRKALERMSPPPAAAAPAEAE